MELSDSPSLDCMRGYEVLADFEQGYYPGVMDTREGINDLIRSSTRARRAFLFKAELHNVENHPLVEDYLKRLKPRTVFLKRRNVLDIVICVVRDCFSDMAIEPGYTTDSDGMKSECFRGRTHEEMDTPPVYLNPLTIIENINIIGSYNEGSYQYLAGMDVNTPAPPVFTSEDLFAFEEEDEVRVNESALTWGRLMKALNVSVQLKTIRTFLDERRTRSPPRRHSELISNFDEIRSVIEHCSDVDPTVPELAYRTEEWCNGVKSMLRL